MENNNQTPSSPPPPPASSSFMKQLFGDNDSRLSPTGIFASIFSSPSTVTRNPGCLHLTSPMQYATLDSQVWSTINGSSEAENVAKNAANANSGVVNTNRRSIFQERIEPCPLSSSIYYGGQEDMYILSSSDLTSKACTKFVMKDDHNHLRSATRGNWWEGSLYY